ncbi:MAG: hypothetical protein JWN85_4176 [Gammaproteobacteria bacterium]|nr:hypothetical protein [Gammaproteobacteria bacterium]
MGEPLCATTATGWLRLLLVLLATVAPMRLPAADTANDSSLLVFPSAQGTRAVSSDRPADLDTHGEAFADVLYTLTDGRLRFLVEAEVSTENAELDRFQLGWEPVPESYIWLGKFHEPSSYWNFERDHGHYLQTAISTPAIETPAGDRAGHDTGVLPENVTGLLLDSSHSVGGSATVQVSFSLGVAANPILSNDRSYWIQPISGGRHRIGWNARLALLQDYPRSSSFGLLASEHILDTGQLANAGSLDARSVDEMIYGAFGDGDWGPWSVHATLYHIDFNLRDSTSPRTQSVVAGYAQLERRFGGRYTAYGRLERSADAENADYIRALRPRFEIRRSLLGMRWDYTRHQAVTIEMARAATSNNQFTNISLQWSALIQ